MVKNRSVRHFAIHFLTSAAQQLNTEQFAEFKRLSRKLVYGPAFQLLLLDCRDEQLRRKLLGCLSPVLKAVKLDAATLTLHTAAQPADDTPPDVAALETQLRQLAEHHQLIHCLGARAWLDAEQRPGRWDALNIRRERVAEHVPRRLLLWLDADGIEQLLTLAPDWWAWRSGVYTFAAESTRMHLNTGALRPPFDYGQSRLTKEQANNRITELCDWLQGELEPELAWRLWFELGELYHSQGRWSQAQLVYRQHVLPLVKILGDVRSIAMTQGRIADTLERLGQFNEALRIRQQEEFLVYEKLGDIRSCAVTQRKIAEILVVQGELDKALRICRQEVLPVFKKLGDAHGYAVTQSKIADILVMCHEISEALHIRQLEVLPVYEKLGDIRSRAVIYGKIADILTVRGQLNEALRIRQREQLPAFVQLGDIRSHAVTQGKIADILISRGQFDKALYIYQQEQLPTYKKLGDFHSQAVIQGKIANILAIRGQLDEALHIRLQEQLPVLEKLGDKHGKTIAQTNIAMLFWLRNADGERERAAELFTQALQAARQLQMAEVADIKTLMRERGLPIPPAAD